jgi:2-polyprenyl-3-methyl-5-hydroxy-6-metoxy-1,4-benzoquinol methylase
MVYANPVASELVSGRFYERLADSYYLSPDKLASDYAPVRFERELRLFRRWCAHGAVLDVGCSTGAFLFQLKHRYSDAYEVLGIDVAEAALDYATGQGLPVRRGAFPEVDFGPRPFDALTFWAVTEHLVKPKGYLRKAAQLLRPGGFCFVLVPNLRSLAVRLLGRRYRYFMPEHLNYFTADTLQAFARAEPAFEVVACQSTHFNPVVIWQDFWRRPGEVPPIERARLLKRTTGWKQNPLLKPVQACYKMAERILGELRLGDNLVLVLRKTGEEAK